LEALFQTWLYFGLLCEFLEANSDSPGATPAALALDDILDFVYNNWTFIGNDGQGLVTSVPTILGSLELWKWTTDMETQKVRCRHLLQCLRLTHWMLYWMPPSFDVRIKYCIATLAEYFNVMLGVKVTSNKWTDVETFFGYLSRGYLSPEIQRNM
jgi:hypothetical protein